jgi:hypothetical protein
MMIRTLRTAVNSLDVIKEIIQELDQNNLEQARQFAQISISYLNKINHDQLRVAHYLYQLCKKLKVLEDKWEHLHPILEDPRQEKEWRDKYHRTGFSPCPESRPPILLLYVTINF